MKLYITLLICCLCLASQAQFDVENQQSYGLRLGAGISTIYDQESTEKVLPNRVSKEISFYSMHLRKRWGARWDLMWAQHTLFLVSDNSRFALDYFNFSFAPVIVSDDKIHRGYLGIYGGILPRPKLYNPNTKQSYVMKPYDVGAILGYELSLYSRVKVNLHVRNSLLNIKGDYSITKNSRWLRNINATIGVSIMLFKTEHLVQRDK